VISRSYDHSELSVLATKWKKETHRSVFERLFDNGQDGNAVRALGEGIKSALDDFQVCVRLNLTKDRS
jgi:hypothetical protein